MRNRGQTMFELVIALGIGVLIITAIVRIVTVSVRNATFAKNKTEATKYAQDALEWLRAEKEKDWPAFFARSSNPNYWCLPTLSWPSGAGQCSGSQTIAGSTAFTRFATLDQEDIDGDTQADDVVVAVSVGWTEGGRTHQTQATTQFGDTN